MVSFRHNLTKDKQKEKRGKDHTHALREFVELAFKVVKGYSALRITAICEDVEKRVTVQPHIVRFVCFGFLS